MLNKEEEGGLKWSGSILATPEATQGIDVGCG